MFQALNLLSNFQVALSVLLTAAGCVIAALGDFSFDLFGYGLALTSVFFQVGFVALVLLFHHCVINPYDKNK